MMCLVALLLVAYLNVVSAQSNLSDPCTDGIIHAADRLPNNTVRLYRDNVYWELNGLPEEEGYLTGPLIASYANYYPGLSPVTTGQQVVTILHGYWRGHTFKLYNRWLRAWSSSSGVVSHNPDRWPISPQPSGLSSAFHNDRQGDALIIGFANGRVYYYSTQGSTFTVVGNPNGTVGGAHVEHYPTEVTASFSYVINGEVYAYLFNGDRYCLKHLRSSQACEWQDSRRLFGCPEEESEPPVGPVDTPPGPEESPTGPVDTPPGPVNPPAPSEGTNPQEGSAAVGIKADFTFFVLFVFLFVLL